MQTEDVIQHLQPWRERWQRSAWRPITQDGESSALASKFAGTPWLAADAAWPVCQQCQTRMPLFLQLNLERLPTTLTDTFGPGLLQLFYCTQCDDAWEPFSATSLVQIVHPIDPANVATSAGSASMLPAKTIVDWTAFVDYPNPQEHEELGLQYTYDWDSHPFQVRVECPAVGLVVEGLEADGLAEEISNAAAGDKLAGWPHWIQGAEYPVCPQ